VEHLAALRSIPNLVVLRPGDANEVCEAWKIAISRRHAPTLMVFTRQNVPTLDRKVFAPASGVWQGAYVLADLGNGKPQLILMASGSELGLIVKAGGVLAAQGISLRLVSFPSWELFAQQEASYRESVLLPGVSARIAVEAGVPMGWERWVGDHGRVIGVDKFGASAPYKVIYEQYGLTVEKILDSSREMVKLAR
jgi:transketolase